MKKREEKKLLKNQKDQLKRELKSLQVIWCFLLQDEPKVACLMWFLQLHIYVFVFDCIFQIYSSRTYFMY